MHDITHPIIWKAIVHDDVVGRAVTARQIHIEGLLGKAAAVQAAVVVLVVVGRSGAVQVGEALALSSEKPAARRTPPDVQ